MNKFMKIAATVALTGALAAAVSTESFARNGRNAAAAAGFVGGLAIGAAAANANNSYYGPSYYHGPRYGYAAPDYAYDSYAYEPAYAEPVYPAYRYRQTDSQYGNGGYDNMGIGSVR